MTLNKVGCKIGNIADPVSNPNCQVIQSNLIADIIDKGHPGDIVFFASLRVPRFTNQGTQRTPDEIMQDARSSSRAPIPASSIDQFSNLLSELEEAQIVVLFDLPKPVFRARPFQCSDWFNASNPVCTPSFTVAVDEIEFIQYNIVTAVNKLTAKHQNLRVWDPLPLLCDETDCNAFGADGRPLFFDPDHLSAYGNAQLIADFERILIDAWR
jgi:hypothetical protein